jgi:hypothetical protein
MAAKIHAEKYSVPIQSAQYPAAKKPHHMERKTSKIRKHGNSAH